MSRNHIITLLIAIACTNLTGCGTIPSYEDLGNGYVEATYIRTSSWEPTAIRTELRYKQGWGTGVIWPKTDGVIVTNDMAVFIGNKASSQPEPGERWPMKPQLFAVRAPELPLDITDEIIGRWAQTSGKDVVKAIAMADIVYFQEKNNKIDFHFVFWTSEKWPDTVITLDWNQISDVMREVKEKGVVHKDLRWGTSYIEKEFSLEVQK
jgi:uncharacterized protein YceK